MVTQYLGRGDTIDYTPSGAVAAGDVIVVGTRLVGIATAPIAANALGSLTTYGLFRVDKVGGSGVTFAVGAQVYWHAGTKKATATTSDVPLGMAVAAAADADTHVDVFLRPRLEFSTEGLGDLDDVADATETAGNVLIADGTDFHAGKIAPISIKDLTGSAGIPVILRTVCTAAGAEDEVVIATPGMDLLILDAFLIARDTNAANVKLHIGTAGSDDVTAAVAKGTVDAVKVPFATIVAAKQTLPAAGTLKANFSAAGSAEVVVICVPLDAG